MPEDDGATSCAGFLETVEEDMVVDFETKQEICEVTGLRSI